MTNTTAISLTKTTTAAAAPLTRQAQWNAIIDMIDNGQYRRFSTSAPIQVQGTGLLIHCELRLTR